MSNWEKISGLQVAKSLRNLVEQEVLPGLEIEASEIWTKLELILHEFMPRNKALLQKRQDIQKKIEFIFILYIKPVYLMYKIKIKSFFFS